MRPVLLLVTFLLLGFAPAPVPRANPRSDLAQLQGEWELIGFSSSGSPIQPLGKPRFVVFKGNQLTWYRGDKIVESTAVFTINPAKKWIDAKNGSHALIGIYEVGKDTLTLAIKSCSIDPVRPPDFLPRDVTNIFIYQRKKR